MISIVDYGLGNIRAFVNLYGRLGVPTRVCRSASEVRDAGKLILPGVGSFDYAMAQLETSGMRSELERLVLVRKVPILGICVGMQMLGRSSEEGKSGGLGWIDGVVRLFDVKAIPYVTQLPHMGWNSIRPLRRCDLFSGLDDRSRFYFLHSYYFQCDKSCDVIATTEYGITYPSAVGVENIFGIQFHPEKSHANGIRVLQNFSKL